MGKLGVFLRLNLGMKAWDLWAFAWHVPSNMLRSIVAVALHHAKIFGPEQKMPCYAWSDMRPCQACNCLVCCFVALHHMRRTFSVFGVVFCGVYVLGGATRRSRPNGKLPFGLVPRDWGRASSPAALCDRLVRRCTSVWMGTTYLFVYHLYVSGRRRAFVAHGVARKVLKTRRARTTRKTHTDQVTRTERVARRTRASRGTCRIETPESPERAERAARRFAHGRTSRRGRVLTVGYPAYAVVPQGSHWSHG